MDELLKTIKDLTDDWMNLDYITTKDIPNIDLYMDQVTTFMDEHLSKMKRNEDDKILTKTMINNYSKNNLLPPSNKKKYSKDHMIFLVFIYYFKNVLSITDIQKLLEPMADSFFGNDNQTLTLEEIYDMIFSLQKEHIADMKDDMMKKIDLSREAFSDINGKENETLFLFGLISLLNFEAYMKKHLAEKLIDAYFTKEDETEKE
ncbi:uncharacterized protein DUF1836 [Natranaerovirga hydrolytica]|uniref:Uncharacterized protein DUF1836 n=1 Tax=Natranaerovirga hydrolytica TaxID=680378 RepID=A0A4R1MDN7_9FIRM|nr:DUF1836 domain-containing protein [Natranaerovirga hydrolytica]TCK90638.1 uncharacterized protein DUF1836 [Natranaerovirga hydrolytica]